MAMKRILLQTAILLQMLGTVGAQQSPVEDAEKLRQQRQARQQQELLRRQDERSRPGRRFRVLNSNATGLSEIEGDGNAQRPRRLLSGISSEAAGGTEGTNACADHPQRICIIRGRFRLHARL